MKKIVFASVLALASISLVAPMLHAQEQPGGTIQIKDPAEFNAYQMATTRAIPRPRPRPSNSFLRNNPQSRRQERRLDM